MEKLSTRLQFLFTSERPVPCVAMLPIISTPFPESRTSRSWKAKRLSATSSRDVCRAAQHISTGSRVTPRKPEHRRICIRSNRHPAPQKAGDFHKARAKKAKRDDRRRNSEHQRHRLRRIQDHALDVRIDVERRRSEKTY